MKPISKAETIRELEKAAQALTTVQHCGVTTFKKQWQHAADHLGKAGIWIDQTDSKRTWPLNYQKLAGKTIKEIDALGLALKENNVHSVDDHKEKIAKQMFKGVKYIAGLEHGNIKVAGNGKN